MGGHFLRQKQRYKNKLIERGSRYDEYSQKSWTRELPKSTTAILPSGRTHTLVGRSNCPGAVPMVPNFAIKCPLGCMMTMRLFRVSAMTKLPM